MGMSMETNRKHNPNPSPEDIKLGYERRDANIKALLQFGFWMAVVIALTLVSMRFTLKLFVHEMPLGPDAAPFVTGRELPPGPRLQVHPHMELHDYCEVQQREVTTYGWVDQRAGAVRIPIDRAMDVILERGLPSRPTGQVPAGVAAPVIPEAKVSGGADVEGQCAYVLANPAAPGSMSTGAPQGEPKD
jgi:hypothetical protein